MIAAVRCRNKMRDGVWGDKPRTWDRYLLYMTIFRTMVRLYLMYFLLEESDKAGARLGPQRSSVCARIGRRW